jgi:hypothetical protein
MFELNQKLINQLIDNYLKSERLMSSLNNVLNQSINKTIINVTIFFSNVNKLF